MQIVHSVKHKWTMATASGAETPASPRWYKADNNWISSQIPDSLELIIPAVQVKEN